jgi:hypothetical protein
MTRLIGETSGVGCVGADPARHVTAALQERIGLPLVSERIVNCLFP